MRQEFNRPTDTMNACSLDLAGGLDELRGSASVVLWLDYMYPEQRRMQLQEVETILERLRPCDLLKVTINAEYKTFGTFGDVEKDEFADLETMAAAKLNDQLGEYLPAPLTTLREVDFPKVLSRAVQLAAEGAVRHRKDVKIVPIISTSYADRQRMVTVACALRPAAETELPPPIRQWEHRSVDWQDLKLIEVPDLSLREKYYIDLRLKESSANILNDLPFKPKERIAAEELHRAIESYKLFHRYYPGFQHVDA